MRCAHAACLHQLGEGLGDLEKARVVRIFAQGVGVRLFGQLVVGTLDLRLGGADAQPENYVRVSSCCCREGCTDGEAAADGS